MTLPNVWNLLNLQANPFFQDTLHPGEPAVYPLSLFVGRERALRRLLAGIGGGTSSRQVIAGLPGVGKTTLAQRVKAEAVEAGYVAYPSVVSLLAEDTTETLLVRILANVYEATLATLGEEVAEADAMVEARHVVQAFRYTSRQAGGGILGGSVSYGSARTFVPPVVFDALGAVGRLLVEIERLACYEHVRRGIVVHLNNLENLVAERDYRHAAILLRNIRDIFLLNNYHWVVVGSTEALEGTLLVHPQVSSVFPTPEPLEPLTEEEFLALLRRRYEYLALRKDQAVRPPVTDEAALDVYRMFSGDLRGTLRALQEGTEALIGYGEASPVAPIDTEALLGVLGPRYRAAFEGRKGASERLIEQFDLLNRFQNREFTKSELQELWDVSVGRVSQILLPLIDDGYIVRSGRRGREHLFRLTGAGHLVLRGRPGDGD